MRASQSRRDKDSGRTRVSASPRMSAASGDFAAMRAATGQRPTAVRPIAACATRVSSPKACAIFSSPSSPRSRRAFRSRISRMRWRAATRRRPISPGARGNGRPVCRHPEVDARRVASTHVMAGLDPAIHVLDRGVTLSWMPGTRPGMTRLGEKAKAHVTCFLSDAPQFFHTSRQVRKAAAWPCRVPARSARFQITPSSIRNRRPDFAMRTPR